MIPSQDILDEWERKKLEAMVRKSKNHVYYKLCTCKESKEESFIYCPYCGGKLK